MLSTSLSRVDGTFVSSSDWHENSIHITHADEHRKAHIRRSCADNIQTLLMEECINVVFICIHDILAALIMTRRWAVMGIAIAMNPDRCIFFFLLLDSKSMSVRTQCLFARWFCTIQSVLCILGSLNSRILLWKSSLILSVEMGKNGWLTKWTGWKFCNKYDLILSRFYSNNWRQ